jgi:hypothetical protein
MGITFFSKLPVLHAGIISSGPVTCPTILHKSAKGFYHNGASIRNCTKPYRVSICVDNHDHPPKNQILVLIYNHGYQKNQIPDDHT